MPAINQRDDVFMLTDKTPIVSQKEVSINNLTSIVT